MLFLLLGAKQNLVLTQNILPSPVRGCRSQVDNTSGRDLRPRAKGFVPVTLQRTEQVACGPLQNSQLAVSTQYLCAKHLTGASKPRFSVKTCIMKTDLWDFPGSPVLTWPSNAGGMGLIAAPGTKIPRALRPKTET